MFSDLVENLINQREGYQVMLHAMVAEELLDPKCSLKELAKPQVTKEKAIHVLRKLEAQRLALTSQLLLEFNLPEDTKLELLCSQADDEMALELLKIKGQLVELVEKIQSISAGTASRSMNRANCFAEVNTNFQKAMKQPSLYSKAGKMSRTSGSLFYSSSV